MKVLHVGVGNLGPGGVRTYLLQVAQGQRERGWTPIVSEIFPDPGHDELLEHSFHSVADLVRGIHGIAPDVVHLHSQLPSYDGLPAACVLTAHEHSAYCPAGSRFLEGKGVECVKPYGICRCLFHHYVDVCGSRHPTSLWRKFRLTRRVVDFRGRWIAPSGYTKSKLVERGLQAARIHQLANPGPPVRLDSPGHARQDGPFEFLFLGRLVPNKGCETAIEAMARVDGDARLVIFGEGPSRGELEGLVARLGLGDRVEFGGWQPPEMVATRLAGCLALVVPSLWPEPFGLVALEAFSRGRPVIASGIGGLLDIVEDGRTGRLVPPGSAEGIAKAFRQFLANPELADSMGVQGSRALQSRFSLDAHLDGLEAIYALSRS